MSTDVPIDARTRRFLRAVGRPLTVLAEPTATEGRSPGGPELAGLRALAGEIRQHTLDHLDRYLDEVTAAIELAGGRVHFAADAAEARRVVGRCVGAAAASVLASPVCDEVGLTTAVAPDAATVVVAATFVVAQTGQVCLTGDTPATAMAAGAPRLVCLVGVESIVPRSADLAVMLKLLSHSATGRPMAGYTAMVGANDRRGLDLVLVDNGRSELLAGEHRSALRCIGCGACTAACPVYASAGVAAAGGLWAGPIGAVVRPALRVDGSAELPHASTLCGACAEVCPVRIDLPAHLIALRRRSPVLARRLRVWGWIALSPARFRWAMRLRRWTPRRMRAAWPTPATQSFHDLWRRRGR